MLLSKPRYDKAEFARRGDEIYERDIRARVEATDEWKFVVIDIEGLPWRRRGRAMLADGSESVFDIYEATVFWDGRPRRVVVDETDCAPLAGMALLDGCELTIQIVDGGAVTITRLPP